jgi:hypothetical protein
MPAFAKFDVWQSTAGATKSIILQVVSTQYTGTFRTSSSTPLDVQGFSATISPSSSTSKILVMVTGFMGGVNDVYPYIILKRNGGRLGDGENSNGSTGIFAHMAGTAIGDTANYALRSIKQNFMDSPGTTAPVTYQIAMASPYHPYGGLSSLNRQSTQDLGNAYCQQTSSSITLMEIGG